jgi:hypothetical protein
MAPSALRSTASGKDRLSEAAPRAEVIFSSAIGEEKGTGQEARRLLIASVIISAIAGASRPSTQRNRRRGVSATGADGRKTTIRCI